MERPWPNGAPVAIVNAHLVDPYTSTVRPGGLILEDGHIIAEGPGVTASSVGGEVVDAKGMFIMPGLVDSHVHLTLDGGADPMKGLEDDPSGRDDPARAVLASANAATMLLAGTTTVRDLGGSNVTTFALRAALTKDVTAGPRVVASGLVITRSGGHGFYLGTVADTAPEVEAATKAQIDAGADCIKIMATGGVHTKTADPDSVAYDAQALGTAARVAHDAGRHITAHAINDRGIRLAVEAKFDSVQHGASMTEETAAALAAAGTRLVPTLGTRWALVEHADDERIPDWIRSRALEGHLQKLESFGRALRHGVAIAGGTDSGSTFVAHGSMPRELAVLVQAGLPTMAALAAGTCMAAEEIGLADEIGRIAVGYQADLIVLSANPVQDLASLDSPVAVYRAGRCVSGIEQMEVKVAG